MNYVSLTNDPLDIGNIYKSVGHPSCGAISLFVGTTRDNFEGKKVSQLEYEAYEPMARKTLDNLINELRANFEIANVAIHHRLGEVPVSEASVVIAISSAHRQASLEAVSYAIDSLKAQVPIFKKEIYEDSNAAPQWKTNAECNDKDDDLQCVTEINFTETADVDSDLVQITANNAEITRRIKSFMKRKREELDLSNLQDFCFHGTPIVERENSCARVDAVLIRDKNSKSHLKVSRVENLRGPQIQSVKGVGKTPAQKLPPEVAASQQQQPQQPQQPCPEGAEERLMNAEKFLGMAGMEVSQGSQLDVFTRLKAIEDRILYLESVSPEYFASPVKKSLVEMNPRKKSVELKEKVKDLERKLKCSAVTDELKTV